MKWMDRLFRKKRLVVDNKVDPVPLHNVNVRDSDNESSFDKETRRGKERRKFTRRKMYISNVFYDLDRNMNVLVKNKRYEIEVAYIRRSGHVRKVPFVLDAYTPTRCYTLREKFYIVAHRESLSFEEEFMIWYCLTVCPYFMGVIVKKENGFELLDDLNGNVDRFVS